MSGRQLLMVIGGAVLGALIVVMILSLLHIQGGAAIAGGAAGGIAGALAGKMASGKK